MIGECEICKKASNTLSQEFLSYVCVCTCVNQKVYIPWRIYNPRVQNLTPSVPPSASYNHSHLPAKGVCPAWVSSFSCTHTHYKDWVQETHVPIDQRVGIHVPDSPLEAMFQNCVPEKP